MKKAIVLMLAALMLVGTENAVSVEAAGQEEETENEASEDSAETSNRTQASLSVGSNTCGMAKKGEHAAMYYPVYTSTEPRRKCVFYENVFTQGSTEEYSVEGNVTNILVDDNNKAYFMMDDCLYQYTYGGTEECLLSDVSYGELIGEIGSRIYFQYAGPEMDVATTHLAYYDTESGQQNEIPADDLQGAVETLIGGSHFFYIGGRTDASAKPLYEIDANSSKVTKIDDYVVSMAYDEAGNLYYTASESADYLSNPLIVKKYDTKSGEVSEVFREPEDMKVGSIVTADNNYLYFHRYDGKYTALFCWDLEKAALETIGGGPHYKYVPNCEYPDRFYFSQYSTDSDGTIISSTLYRYLLGDRVLEANEIYGYIQAVAGNCLLADYGTYCQIEGFHAAVYK